MQPTSTSEREVGCCHHTVHFAHAPDWYAVGNEFKKRASRGCKKIISFVLYAQKRLIFSRRVTTCFAVGSLCILRTRERGAEDGGASLSAFRRGWRWLSARLGCGGSCWDIFSDPVLGNSHAPLREGALGIKQGGGKKSPHPAASACRLLLHRGHSSHQKREGIARCVWLGSGGGCACMCSAPYGRKKRPRSTGSIFPLGKAAQTETDRRESTEGAVDDSRMVGTEIRIVVMSVND